MGDRPAGAGEFGPSPPRFGAGRHRHSCGRVGAPLTVRASTMHQPLFASIAAAAAAGLLCTSAQAVLLVNGDFEAPLVADGTYELALPTGWSRAGLVMNPTTAGIFTAAPGNLWPLPASGAQYMDIGNNLTGSGSFSQSFAVRAAGTTSSAGPPTPRSA